MCRGYVELAVSELAVSQLAVWIAAWLVLGSASATLGCSHPAKKPPASAAAAPAPATAPPPPPAANEPPPCKGNEPLRVVLTATARLNPGAKGEALATVIRLYQLKDVNKLVGVGFDDLLDHDKDTLGEDFVAMQEVTLNPGEQLEPAVTRNPAANYLLAVALFRQPAGTTWKASKRLSPPDPQFCNNNEGVVRMALDENRIELR
jgi:type VI secretion system VasD/TssJ family lipoprotein